MSPDITRSAGAWRLQCLQRDRFRRLLQGIRDVVRTPKPLVAEADGNRTRLPALAGTPVLKTGGPTRRPDASAIKDKRTGSQGS